MSRLWRTAGMALVLLGYAVLVAALCIAICGYVNDCLCTGTVEYYAR